MLIPMLTLTYVPYGRVVTMMTRTMTLMTLTFH